jgi:HEAT repeat protein
MKTTFTKRAIRSSVKWSRNLRNFAGLAMLAAMLPFTTGYGQPQKPDGATGADVPAATKTEIAKLQSANLRERADAIMKLRYLNNKAEAAIPHLIQMLGSETEFPQVVLMISSLSTLTKSCFSEYTFSGEAAETLARIGKMSDALLALPKSDNWRIRANAIRALGGLKDRRAAGELIAILDQKEERWEVKGNAALALGLMGDLRAAKPLITLLNDQNAHLRASAATALGPLKAPGSLPPLIATLKDRDPQVRIKAAGSLGRLGDSDTVEPLIQALQDEDQLVREVAAAALHMYKDQRATKALIAALQDSYTNVRINAAGALGQTKSPEAVEPLVGLLTNDNELGDARAREALMTMVQREDREFGLLRGLQALTKLGHPGAAKALKQNSYHRADWKEWWRQNKTNLLDR